MKIAVVNLVGAALLVILVLTARPASAQQFNSDNYLSKPYGVATIILTAGERNTMWMTTFSLFTRWEFTAAAYIFNSDDDPLTAEGYSTSYYAKYMIFENAAKTGGLAVKAGTGLEPGYVNEAVQLKDAFQTYWMNAPVTVPFFNNKLSWDLMPGLSVTRQYGEGEETVGAFTYATRMAWYPTSPEISLVGEVYGSKGQTEATPEYRVGLRWEPSQSAVFALSYDDEFDGINGAGVEFGVMLFTPSFCGL
ncbi:MAG TPA: hypothetical protein VFS09_03370 [Candidatus Eisenbacteria bacterium]|nr:hypothetical protein [Candidatus Eisenbacteria bacterium]